MNAVDPPAPGLYPDVPAPVYRRWRAASQSILAILRDRSPAHAYEAMVNPPPQTDAERLGEAVHMAVLQPDLFARRYVRGPEGDRRTKAVREAWQEVAAANPGATILLPAEYDQIIAIRDAVYRHPTARKLFGGEAERSAVWRDPDTGVLCKGRFDEINRTVGCITDLKTTQDASPAAFTRAIYGYRYYLQAAHYLAGAQALGIDVRFFVIIAVEKEPPYGVAIYHVSGEAIRAGLEELRPLLTVYARCMETGVWPSYPAEAVEITLPPWAWRQIDERVGRA